VFACTDSFKSETRLQVPRGILLQVEGHQCHRVAHAHRKLMLKKKFVAVSPNKRFSEGERTWCMHGASCIMYC